MYSSWKVGTPWMEVIEVDDDRKVFLEDEVENDSDDEPESSE